MSISKNGDRVYDKIKELVNGLLIRMTYTGIPGCPLQQFGARLTRFLMKANNTVITTCIASK